jgi:superfamily II DNA or RNA helicase
MKNLLNENKRKSFLEEIFEKHQLRDYQERAVLAALHYLKIYNSIVLVAPTGAGKTRIMRAIVDIAFQTDRKLLEFSHRDFLLQQFSEELEKINIPYGTIRAGHKKNLELNKNIQVGMINSIFSKWDYIFPQFLPDLLLFDESHHGARNKKGEPNRSKKLIDFVLKMGGKCLGVTATPKRLDTP